MGAVEAAKAGVGSAMNDVTQMLAGALSIAVVGSVMYAIYAARLGDAVASLPAEAGAVVRDSIRGGQFSWRRRCHKRTRSPWPPLRSRHSRMRWVWRC